MSDRFLLDVAESDGQADVRLTVAASSTDNAGRIVDIVRGLVALAQVLIESDPEGPRGALDGIAVEADGSEIHLRITAPSDQLFND